MNDSMPLSSRLSNPTVFSPPSKYKADASRCFPQAPGEDGGALGSGKPQAKPLGIRGKRRALFVKHHAKYRAKRGAVWKIRGLQRPWPLDVFNTHWFKGSTLVIHQVHLKGAPWIIEQTVFVLLGKQGDIKFMLVRVQPSMFSHK